MERDERDERRDRGAFYTPPALAAAITRRALALHPGLPELPTLLDPACGDGVFLQAAAAELPSARLIGLEQHPAACAAAQSAVPDAELCCCDGLDPVAGPPRASVDLVLGNPPYVRCRRLPATVRDTIKRHYATARGAFNLSVPFVERSLQWLRPGGVFALVLPNKLLVAAYAGRLRSLLCAEATLLEVLDLSEDDPFAAAAYPVVLFARRGPAPAGHRVRLVAGDVRREGGWRERQARSVPQSPQAIGEPAALDPLAERVWGAGFAPLGDLLRLREGLHTGNMRSSLVSDRRRWASDRRLLRGRDCQRYHLRWAGLWTATSLDQVRRPAGGYANIPPLEVFDGPKLLLREISRRPAACLDPDDHVTLNKVYPLQELRPLDARRRFAALGLLNSGPFARLFRARWGATHLRGGYLQFKAQYMHPMPVPPLEELVRRKVNELAAAQCLEALPARDLRIDAEVLAAYGAAGLAAPSPLV